MSLELAELRKEIAQCTRCGACQESCAVHKKLALESTSARGKIYLMQCLLDGKAEYSDKLSEILNACLSCKTCRERCPSGVKTDLLFLAARKAVAERQGLPLIKKLMFTALPARTLFETALALGPLAQQLFFRPARDGDGYFTRIPIPAAGLTKRRLLPKIAGGKALRKRMVRKRLAKPQARVAFFPGCMMNYVYPQAGMAVVDVLRKNNVDVEIPEDIHCCGLIAFTSGDFATAELLAERNVRALSAGGYDAIITACGSCGAALSHDYGLILDKDSLLRAHADIAGKVRDLTSFLVELPQLVPFGELHRTVTYHDSCHLARDMKVREEPRRLLHSIPGLDLKEMAGADECCGCGGTFSMANYALSCSINDAKTASIADTGAETVVTGCSACRMHITDGLRRRSMRQSVLHTAEIMSMAYGALP